MNRGTKLSIVVISLIATWLLSWSAFKYVSVPEEISKIPWKLLVSATWRGEFKNYKSYVLEIPKDSLAKNEGEPIEFDAYGETVAKFSFAEGFIAQEFCELGNRVFVAWGKFWTDEDAKASGKIYELTTVSGATVPRIVATTSDFRFRDCSFGTSFGKTYLWSVTQGDGYFHLIDTETWNAEVRHVPFYGKSNNKVTTLHFVEFADLDNDGNEEAYMTATTPEYGRFDNQTGYQEGEIMAATIDKSGKLSEVTAFGELEGEFVKRLKKIRVGNSDVLLAGIEGKLSENGESKTPFRAYAFGYENGIKVKKSVIEVLNKECKEFTTFSPYGKSVPSFQLWCDNGEMYSYEILGKGIGDLSFKLVGKIELNEKISEWYLSQRDMLYFWDVVQIHSIFWNDIDNDGKEELFVGVNNTWFFQLDLNPDGTYEKKEIFHIKRTFPEPVGRLMIFSISSDENGDGYEKEPLIKTGEPVVPKPNP